MIMPASQSQNLPQVLDTAEAIYHGSAAQLPSVGRQTLARHLASGVRFGLDEPEGCQR